MLKNIHSIEDGSGTTAIESCDDILLILGGNVDSLTHEQMLDIWEITVTAVFNIYKNILA